MPFRNSRVVGLTGSNPDREVRIGNEKSASGYQFLRVFLTTAHPAPADVIINRIVKTLLAPEVSLRRLN